MSACATLVKWQSAAKSGCLHVVDGHLAGLSEGLIIESCFAHFEQVPVVSIELLIDVDDIQVFVLHKLSTLGCSWKEISAWVVPSRADAHSHQQSQPNAVWDQDKCRSWLVSVCQ